MLGELDQFARQQLQSPTGTTLARSRASRRDQQGFFFPGELTLRSRTWLLAQSRVQVAQHKAALGPIDGLAAHADAVGNGFIADARVGSQQDLCSLKPANRVLSAA